MADDTFPAPLMNDPSASIGMGLGQTLSNLQPSSLVYDPFQFQRPQYMSMLSKLATDPSSITTTPWYQSGIESVKRGMSKGYLDSGNMALALSNYGQDQYYKQLTMLSQLAGSGMGPTNVGGAMVGARQAGADLQSKALGTQRYQDLQRLLDQARNNGGSPSNPWAPPGTPGGVKNPPYKGAPTPKSPQDPNQPTDPNADWEQEMQDIFPGMSQDEIYNMIFGEGESGNGGGEQAAPAAAADTGYGDFFGDYGDFGGGDVGGGGGDY